MPYFVYSMQDNDSCERNKWEKNEKINRKFFKAKLANSLIRWMNEHLFSFYVIISKKWIK